MIRIDSKTVPGQSLEYNPTSGVIYGFYPDGGFGKWKNVEEMKEDLRLARRLLGKLKEQ